MKKIIALLLITLSFACKQKSNSDSIVKIEKRKIDTVLEEILIKKYPNYLSNDLINEKATKELVTKVDSLLANGVLNEFPLKIMSISKNPHGKGALVQLYVDNGIFTEEKNHEGLLSNSVQFDVIALMSEEKAEKLIKDECYLVTGKTTRVNQNQLDILVKMSYYGASPSIEESYSDKKPMFKIGAFVVEVESLKHYPIQLY